MRMLLKFFVLALFALPAAAQDTAEKNRNNQPYKLDLPQCEFIMELPGEPYNSYRCNPDDPDSCHRIISFTKVYGIDATMNFNVTCNPAEPGSYERYSGEVMKATLDAMVGRGALEEYKTDFAQGENFKQAILIGSGKSNDHDKIYSAQLWIGQTSIFTVEAELIGFAGEEEDALFADMVGSIRPREATAETNPESAEKAAE